MSKVQWLGDKIGVGDLPACLASCESAHGVSSGSMDLAKLAQCTSACVTVSQIPPGGIPGGQVPIPIPVPPPEEPPPPASKPKQEPSLPQEPPSTPTPKQEPTAPTAPVPAPTTPTKPAAVEEAKTPWGWIALGGLALVGVVWAVSRGAGEVGGTMASNPEEPTKFKLHLERVRLDRGGYDSSGRYWGIGEPLYRYYDDSGELDGHVRGVTRAAAKERLHRYYPSNVDVSFYRA